MQKVLSVFILLLLTVTIGISQNGFTLSSKTLGGNATQLEAFNNFGCTGENSSPELHWENPPEGTKSFAITMYDPDAPTGSGWWHWVVFDIPADTKSVVQNAGDITKDLLPEQAIQTINNYGGKGYGGPCPPQGHGIHQYLITVHALDTESLGLDDTTDPAVVGYNLWVHTIEKASMVTYYRRDKE
ncbi:MAG: YbhB/YbcL family Raf kinase inhibitor-like protein [Bacteroidota bacterium]